MSFSSEIKDKVSLIENKCKSCRKAQLSALIRYAGRIRENELVLSTENEAAASCMTSLIREVYSLKTHYTYGEKSRLYEIVIDDEKVFLNICTSLLSAGDSDDSFADSECCLSSYIRGAFLGGGSISDPYKSYHLEFDARHEPEADRLQRYLIKLGVTSKITCRKKHHIVYIKEYSLIADVLSVIGASNAAFDIYNISIEKDVRNNINRQMNCENANMDKIADAYLKHLSAIEKVKKTIGIDKLPDTLQEIAEIRVKYPEDSLKQLGERLEKPIGKSGVNHRLNRIVEIANEI